MSLLSKIKKEYLVLMGLILIGLSPFYSRIIEFYSNKEIYESQYKAVIVKKSYYRGSLNITYKALNSGERESIISVNDSLYKLYSIGDTIIKLKNSNKCRLLKNDSVFLLPYAYMDDDAWNK